MLGPMLDGPVIGVIPIAAMACAAAADELPDAPGTWGNCIPTAKSWPLPLLHDSACYFKLLNRFKALAEVKAFRR